VELFHDGELMEDSYKLMDVAYMSDWNRVSDACHVTLLSVCLSVCLSVSLTVPA